MFKFREIKEIKNNEIKNTVADEKKNEGFMNIKPETDLTVEEARNFIDSLFGI